jgi:hypothetical protein
VQRPPEQLSQEISQTVVLYGDGQQAIALRAMEALANSQTSAGD